MTTAAMHRARLILTAARTEIAQAQARAQGRQPNRDCAAEANALALDQPVN
jgi:hypothetical protein